MGGAGLNSNVISSVRSGRFGGSGGVFGAPGAVHGMSKDKDGVKASLDQIFGKIGSGDFMRNQGIARASGGGTYGYAPVNISAEEQKKFKDMVAEIVGGVAVSNLQVAHPVQQPVQQPLQPIQPLQLAQPVRGAGGGLDAKELVGQQKVNSNQISQVYHEAIQQLKSLQQQEQIIQQRINLLSTLVENYGPETRARAPFYLILSSLIIIIIVVLFTKMKIHYA